MILTRRFGGLRMHDVITPPTEESEGRTLEDTRAPEESTETTTVEGGDDRQRTAA